MRVAHLSDFHYDASRRIAGSVRDVDGRPWGIAVPDRCLREVVAAAGKVDLWALTGDTFDRASPAAGEIAAVVDFVTDLAQSAPVVVLAGNHDVPLVGGGGDALEALRRRERVTVCDRPQVLKLGGGTVVALPYPRRAEIATACPKDVEPNVWASKMLERLLVSLGEQALLQPGPRLLLWHGSIDGAEIRHQPRSLAHDIVLSLPALLSGPWDAVLCGHIHQRQALHPKVRYAGSPDRCDFGEEGDPKGGLLWTFGEAFVSCVELDTTKATVYRTVAPHEYAGGVPGVVLRVKGQVDDATAVALRQRIAADREGGALTEDAIDVDHVVRLRDAAASRDEPPEDFLRRWLSERPEPGQLADEHGGTVSALVDDVAELHRQTDEEASP